AIAAEPGFTPSVKARSMLADAETLLALAEKARRASAPELNLTALAAGLWAGDLAVVERARLRIERRGKREGFLFGCAGFEYPYGENPGLKEIFDRVFNYATLPFYLARVEREKGKPDYPALERLQDAFQASGIVTKGHPLWWAHTAGMPPWTADLKWEDGSMRREIDRVIGDRVRHFAGRIRRYDIINEAHDWCNAWMMKQDELADMTCACADAVRNAGPDCRTVEHLLYVWGKRRRRPGPVGACQRAEHGSLFVHQKTPGGPLRLRCHRHAVVLSPPRHAGHRQTVRPLCGLREAIPHYGTGGPFA
ncbi:MAG: endo-1,4-beta-xylanase, partial [Treponema sp.]|nr:endo-1,4-beta-xylanase [Treponema sp.]